MEQLLSLGTALNLPRLGKTKSIWLGVVAAAVMLAVGFVAVRPSEPMGLLYSGLDPAEAGKVGQRLDELKIAYEARADGTSIVVPQSQVGHVRMELAASGLPHQGGTGYELLDSQSPMNMTSFMQRVQRVRALEGELARTIATLDNVKSARVHIVLPEREGFSRETPQPTASITVITDHAVRLTASQAAAVRLLVAGAVPRMRQEDVSVLDPSGVVLAADDGTSLSVGRLGDLKSGQEQALQHKVLNLLEPLVGPGKVRVAVAEDLESTRETQREEKFDPLTQVERSRQTQNDRDNSDENRQQAPVTVGQNLPNQQAGAGAGTRNTTTSAHTGETINYEISSTLSERVREPGELKRLTVAVVVDGATDAAGTYLPRPQGELDRLGELVRSAVGYNDKRGDKVTVETMHFLAADPLGTASGGPEAVAALSLPVKLGIGAGAAVLLMAAAGGGMLVTRRRRLQELALLPPEEAEVQRLPGSADPVEDLFSLQAVGGTPRSPLLIQLHNTVDSRPDEVLAVLRAWISEGTVT